MGEMPVIKLPIPRAAIFLGGVKEFVEAFLAEVVAVGVVVLMFVYMLGGGL